MMTTADLGKEHPRISTLLRRAHNWADISTVGLHSDNRPVSSSVHTCSETDKQSTGLSNQVKGVKTEYITQTSKTHIFGSGTDNQHTPGGSTEQLTATMKWGVIYKLRMQKSWKKRPLLYLYTYRTRQAKVVFESKTVCLQ
ncbi:hypothetical protein LSAT2_002867 [Lamellibrachia satsuma]|nr:hypothetical protein LSAT2_002867 [Lamellibrachia satsuma]